LLDLLSESVRQVFVFEVIVLGLESALYEIVGVVDYQSEELRDEGSNEVSPRHIVSTAQLG
jgi:hypothetical protein